ncbi:hypothetical protein BDV35DRAFT_380120 [Aspergillus flavus]|uniref:RRM domain-containing protein n=1 Tax=Aspergillus flavus TaxID=5059 RepID=A0A5N6H1H2_ASPFL|nr:hypothetical protein BDV35DRAFT_380120 [Aspergillus flavus]
MLSSVSLPNSYSLTHCSCHFSLILSLTGSISLYYLVSHKAENRLPCLLHLLLLKNVTLNLYYRGEHRDIFSLSKGFLFDPLFILGATNPKQHSSQENKSSANSDSVTISNSEYQGLYQLSSNSSKVCTESSLKCKKTPSPTRANLSNDHKRWESYDDDDEEEEEEEEEGVLLASQDSDRDDYEDSSRSSESSIASTPQRTILLRGLPDRATHRDLVEAIKGGALLHVHLRTRERMASISFVEEANAQEFYQHAKSHGVCIAGKRVEISWNDRQFYLPPFVRAKINTGASRNLVLYNVHPNVTEWLIRKDLDHIHNLIVITVKFKNGNAYISTNSVHNALFARSCMMSRLTYKGMRIAFYPDECAEPLSKLTNGLKKESQVPSKKSVSALNRFQLLSLDGAEEDETDHDHGQVGLDSYRQNTALKVQY